MTISMNVVGQQATRDGQNRVQRTNVTQKNPARVSVQKQEAPEEDTQKTLQEIKAQIAKLQETVNANGKKIRFNVNQDLGQVIIKIVDSETDKVIKEIPSVEIQKLQANFERNLSLLIDEQI